MKSLYLIISFVLGCLLLAPALDAYEMRVDTDTVIRFENGRLFVSRDQELVMDIAPPFFDYTYPVDADIVEADEDRLGVVYAYPSVVDFQHRADDRELRTATVMIERIPGGFHMHASPEWANHTTLYLQDMDDHVFGISEPLQPNNQKSPDLRGATIDLVLDSDGDTLVENYASAYSSFFMSSNGYGAFFDTFAEGRYQFAVDHRHTLHHATGKLDWYVFFGDDGTEILRSYYQVIGKPKHVPMWGLGPVLWRDQNDGGAAEILDDVRRFTELEIPMTAWFVDRPYSNGAHAWSEMDFNEQFAHPEAWIGKLNEEYGLEFMTWTSTAFFGDVRFNRHLDTWHTYLDLSDSESVAAFQAELAKQYAVGVKGHKMDRADEQFPVNSPWADESVPEKERRHRYVYEFAKVHDEALRQAWGKDQFTFARAAIHRSQPYLSAVWGGDPRSNWDGFQGNFANGIRCGFMGFPLWGSDVGGYLGEGWIPKELYARWLQAGSMSGLFEVKLDGAGGDGRDRMPWNYGEDLQAVFRKVCEERMELLPSLYSWANNAAETGVLMQPMAYRHLQDPQAWAIWDQFYLGDRILVAPVFIPEPHRKVYLPAGKWYDFDEPVKEFTGGKTILVDAPLDKLPRFVKANSLYVTGKVYAGNAFHWDSSENELVIHAFPGTVGEAYEFTYLDSLHGDRRCVIHLKRTEEAVELEVPEMGLPVRVEMRLDDEPVGEVLFQGQELSEEEWSIDSGLLKLKLSPQGGILTVKP